MTQAKKENFQVMFDKTIHFITNMYATAIRLQLFVISVRGYFSTPSGLNGKTYPTHPTTWTDKNSPVKNIKRGKLVSIQ